MPKPHEVRSVDEARRPLKHGLDDRVRTAAPAPACSTCCSRFQALPASVKTTPRMPTLSMIGNSSSRFW